MQFDPTIILFAVFLILGVICYALGFYFLKIKHLIQNTPTSKIRSIAMGFVEISGKVIPLSSMHTFLSPFSNQKCVYYRYTIEEYRQSKNSSYWVVIKQDTREEKFYVKDETGQVLIDPANATIDISKDTEYNSRMGKDPPLRVIKFLNKQNVRYEGILFGINKTMRYREYLIKPEDTLYIMGTAEDNPYVKDATTTEGTADLMIKKGKHIKLFLISEKSEKKILQKYTLLPIFFLLFGTIILILCLFGIFKTVI
jgi:hypothetical protein